MSTIIEMPEPANIVERIEQHLNKYMVFPEPEQATACALWILHSWTFSASFPQTPWTTPYLYVNSSEPQSGKTLLIELMESLVLNPERATDMTASVMFTLIETVQPTLLVDEVDAVWSGAKNEALRGVLNGGYKRGGYVWRKEGSEPVKYNTFSPKLLAGIDNGHLPETIETRCLRIDLRRVAKLDDEGRLIGPDGTPRETYYAYAGGPEAEQLAKEIEAFMAEWKANYTPYMPKPMPGIAPRAWEILMPLVQIAHHVGIEDRVREALAKLMAPKPKRETPEIQALRVVKELFESTGADKLHTTDMLRALNETLGEGWNGKLLSNRLGQFIDGNATTLVIANKARKGYYRHQFEHAFNVHL